MKSESLVSIVVPIFNIEDYIEQCIESIINQDYSNLEIILVNDGSTDSSGSLCDKYSTIDKRVKVIHKQNGGLVSARKAGTNLASGQYLSFVDGDDWIKSNHISNLVKSAIENSCDISISGHERYFLGKVSVVTNNIEQGIYNRDDIERKIIPKFLYNGNFFQHGISTYVWNKLFLTGRVKELISSIDNQIVMAEDSCLTYPYILDSQRIAISTEATYVYRQRADSIVKSVPNIQLEYQRLSLAFKHLNQAFTGYPKEFELKTQLRNYFYSLLVIRSGATFINQEKSYIPFSNFTKKGNLIIYSTGAFGQQIYRSFLKFKSMNILGWLDEDYDESKKEGLNLIKEEKLQEIEFDNILIASIDPDFMKNSVDKMLALGIPMHKISLFDLDLDKFEEVIDTLGFSSENYSYNE